MGEVLSQDEIDALLSTMGPEDEAAQAQEAGDGTSAAPSRSASPKKTGSRIGVPYDFRHPNKFLKEHIENLRLIFDDLAKLLSAVFTLKYRMSIQVQFKALDQMSYEEFLDISQLPTVYGIFPFIDGRSILGLDRNVAFLMMQNLLGGKNVEAKLQARELTDIEGQIMARLFDDMLKHFAEVWKSVIEKSDLSIDEVENNIQPLNLAPLNEIVVRTMMDIKMGEVTGFLSICIPYMCVQSIMDDILNMRQFVSEKPTEISREYHEILEDKIRRTQVPVKVELGEASLSFKDILFLKVGDIIQLETSVNEQLRVKVGGRIKFFAESGTEGKRMSVQINRPFEDD